MFVALRFDCILNSLNVSLLFVILPGTSNIFCLIQIYTNCACVPGMNVSVTPGLCQDNDCSMLYPFLISMSVGAFLGTISMMPGLIIKIRYSYHMYIVKALNKQSRRTNSVMPRVP